ncbi:rhamnogalacturonan acetylesterase [candidate division KSB1 bacterium]|nr:rhamnogalacturonan acetylesterase [candidate division KSB1 bacterium]
MKNFQIILFFAVFLISKKYGQAQSPENTPAEESLAITEDRSDSSSNFKTEFRFDFGPGKVEPGYVQVLPGMIYSDERGYGFESGASITGRDCGGDNALRDDFCASDLPFFFSVAVPEGTYRVSATLGDKNGESVTTVKAELRRLMLEKIVTGKKEFKTGTFMVNVRTPQIPGGGQVNLKDREKTSEAWAWDNRLSLEFNNTRPVICALEIVKTDKTRTIYLMGDSTVCDQPGEPYNSWGQMLTRFFNTGVVIANHAESGSTYRASLGRMRLDKVLSQLNPGDYVFMQFGHNDMKQTGEGDGPFTSYKSEMKLFISRIRERGGSPVLLTPMHRRTFNENGQIVNSHGDYPEAVRQTAEEENVPLIDLHAMSKKFYEALGAEGSVVAFSTETDGSHHNNYGSYQLAKCVIEGIKQNNLDIQEFLIDAPPFDPGFPDSFETFDVPASPGLPGRKPDGQ